MQGLGLGWSGAYVHGVGGVGVSLMMQRFAVW